MIELEQIAAEVLQMRCYIVQGDGQHFGRTHPRLDLYYEYSLREQGRWAGRRPAIEINHNAIKEWSEGDQKEIERLTLTTLAHEIAHVADRDPPYYDSAPTDAFREFERLCIAASSERTTEESQALRAKLNLPPWFSHGTVHPAGTSHCVSRFTVDRHQSTRSQVVCKRELWTRVRQHLLPGIVRRAAPTPQVDR